MSRKHPDADVQTSATISDDTIHLPMQHLTALWLGRMDPIRYFKCADYTPCHLINGESRR